MKKSVIFVLVSFAFLAFCFSFVSATFSLGNPNYSLEKQYSPSEGVKGWINISFDNEPVDSLFETGFGAGKDLKSVLDLNGFENGEDYTCSTGNCQQDYFGVEGSEEQTKTFTLNSGESKTVGFKLLGEINNVNSASFNISSNAAPSCSNQLELDVFNDGIDFANQNAGEALCGTKSYSCFDKESSSIANFNLKFGGTDMYCQKFTFPQSPGLNAGVWLKEITDGDVNMSIQNSNGDLLRECALPEISSEGEYNCNIDYAINTQGDYYICATAKSGEFQIKGETNDKCGFPGEPSPGETEVASYQISAQAREFTNFGELKIDYLKNDFLSIEIQNYLKQKYGNNMDCPASGCIVPIKLTSKTAQEITLRNLEVSYTADIGEPTLNSFINLTQTSARISSGFLKIILNDAGLSVPSSFGSSLISLSLGNSELLNENISVKKIPEIVSLNPRIVPAAYPIEFVAFIDKHGSTANVTKYEWNFGDGKKETTFENKVSHAYDSIGNFSIEVKITDTSKYTVSKIFIVEVQTPVNAVNILLRKKLTDLANVRSQVDGYPAFYKSSFNSLFDFDSLNANLSSLQQRNASASNDEEYVSIMKDLVRIKIPEEIKETETANSFLFFPLESDINPEIVSTAGGGDYSSSQRRSYVDAITLWNINNAETKIDFHEFSAVYDSDAERILNVFSVNVKKSSPDEAFLFVEKIDGLKFKQDYSERESGNYFFIPLQGNEKTIEFSTTEDFDVFNLPAFVSPGIQKLSVSSPTISGTENLSRQTLLVLIIILLIFLALAAYIIMQTWYKKRYEDYLFRNKNDLHNLISYIGQQSRKGAEANEISSRLKKSGWSSEQVRYIMRKYHGKRTGMFEIPLNSILNLFKKEEKTPPRGNIPGGGFRHTKI
ncbi:MAG: PKD domain-containing protein [archaeon]